MPHYEFVDWRLNRKARHLSTRERRLSSKHPLLSSLFITGVGHITRGLGHRYERQTIDETILLYCVEGQGWLRSGAISHPLQAGDVGFVVQGTPHGYGADDADPWSIYWAHCSGSQISAFLDLLAITPDTPVLSLPTPEFSPLIQSFKAMLALLNVDLTLPYLLAAGVYLRQIFSTLVLAKTASPPPQETDDVVGRAIQFMHTHITGTLRLADMALQTNMSPSHFHRQFRQATGHAPIDYFIRLKVQHACELLNNTDMKIGEIGHFLGYQDAHYFSRIFKQITGQSPRRFRAACRSGSQSLDYHTLL
jgi:AraC-like DNA-binding protein